MKRRFTEWYSKCIAVQLDEGKEIEDVAVQLKLSVLKPLHANWIIDLFNYFTSEKGREIISTGWKAAFITEAISTGSHGLESLDPFRLSIHWSIMEAQHSRPTLKWLTTTSTLS